MGIFPAFADETEWVDPQNKTLRLKESFVREGLQIEASDFYNSTELMALITVYDTDHTLLTRNITRKDDYFTINDRLNITIIDLQERRGNISASRGLNVTVDQWVKIQTRVTGKPSPKLSIVPYEKQINNKTIVSRIFIQGSEIWINFSIKNDGKAVLKSLTLKVNSTLPLLSGEKLNYELPSLMAGNESEVITIRFKAPFTEERKSFTISAEAKGRDIFGRSYQAVDSTYIEVVPLFEKIATIELRKYVSEKVYMGDIAVVSISIKNNGTQIINNISLFESLPAGVEPLDTNLTWNLTLGPLEQKSISYKIKPKKPGIYFFLPGSSRIEYQGRMGYNAKLNKLIVNGAYVVLMKSASLYNPVKGENIIITVEAKNTGDATAIVKLSDAVPADHLLTSEIEPYKMIDTMVLHAGSSASFSYILNTTDAGSYVLPPVKATVLDQFLYQDERYTQKSISNDLVIDVREPVTLQEPSIRISVTPARSKSTETSVAEISAPKPASGFHGYIIFIMLLILSAIKKRGNDV